MSWLVNINSIIWEVPPYGNQSVDISYREGGTSGYWISSGTIVFAPAGSIVGIPDPFVIPDLPDYWDSVEVQAINECNEIEFLKTFDKP